MRNCRRLTTVRLRLRRGLSALRGGVERMELQRGGQQCCRSILPTVHATENGAYDAQNAGTGAKSAACGAEGAPRVTSFGCPPPPLGKAPPNQSDLLLWTLNSRTKWRHTHTHTHGAHEIADVD